MFRDGGKCSDADIGEIYESPEMYLLNNKFRRHAINELGTSTIKTWSQERNDAAEIKKNQTFALLRILSP